MRPATRTAHALALLASGQSYRQASQAAGINQSTLVRAMQRQRANAVRCPTCGQVVKPPIDSDRP